MSWQDLSVRSTENLYASLRCGTYYTQRACGAEVVEHVVTRVIRTLVKSVNITIRRA
jgi:hypothetical protein